MERIVDGSNLDNLTWILVHFLQFNGGIFTNNIVNKLVSFGTNGVWLFWKEFKMEFQCSCVNIIYSENAWHGSMV
jgi:hypothetical protein